MAKKKSKRPEGIAEFEDLMRGLVEVPKKELNQQIDKYKAKKSAKKAKEKRRAQ